MIKMLVMFMSIEEVRVFCWGRADYGQLGLGDDVVKQGFCSEPTEISHVRGAKQVNGGLI